MKIIFIDDEPLRIEKYLVEFREFYGREAVEYRDSIELLHQYLHESLAKDPEFKFGLVLDIMFGEGGSTDGLDKFLLDPTWGPYLIHKKVPVVVLTNKNLETVTSSIFGAKFQHPEEPSVTLEYSKDSILILAKQDLRAPKMRLKSERLFKK